MEVNIKYFDSNMDKPTKIDKGDWIDLRCVGVTEITNANLIEEDVGFPGNKPYLRRVPFKHEVELEEGILLNEFGEETEVKFFRIRKGAQYLLDLGVAMQLPEGYEAYVAPRGSTYKTFKVIQTNSIGIVDNSFKGDNDKWFMPVLAMENSFIIYNERVCQFRIQKKMDTISFNEKEIFGTEDRGSLGSTGTK